MAASAHGAGQILVQPLPARLASPLCPASPQCPAASPSPGGLSTAFPGTVSLGQLSTHSRCRRMTREGCGGVCATPRTKLARASAKFQLHGICSRFSGHSFRLPQGCLLPSQGTGPALSPNQEKAFLSPSLEHTAQCTGKDLRLLWEMLPVQN